MVAKQELIRQGAEARVYKTSVDGRTVIAKQRFSKGYRHPDLDQKLTRGRLNQEARSLQRCREQGIRVPEVVRTDKGSATLYMEFVPGPTLKEWIIGSSDGPAEQKLMATIGEILYRLHSGNIIHGDLTTSNMIVGPDGELVLIDFGLSQISPSAEDKAVDLYVLERAFVSTHPDSEGLFASVLEAYARDDLAHGVLRRLESVRLRGRKRDMTGRGHLEQSALGVEPGLTCDLDEALNLVDALSAAAPTEFMLRYGRFEGMHRQQLEALGLPRKLWRALFTKLSEETFDIGKWVAFGDEGSDSSIGGRRLQLNREALEPESNVFLVDHAWTTSVARALDDLDHVPGLLERMEQLTGVSEPRDETAADTEPLDDAMEASVPVLVSQKGVSVERARRLLREYNGDILEAMMASDDDSDSSRGGAGMQDSIMGQIQRQLEGAGGQDASKAIQWKTRRYECGQYSLDEGGALGGIDFRVPLAPGARSSDVSCSITPTHMTLTVLGSTVVDGDLYARVDVDSSTWTIEDGVLTVSLVKQEPVHWPEAIVGEQHISPLAHQKHLRRVLRELWRYFQGYDFLARGADQSLAKQTNWYIQDEVGLAVAHSDDPNVRCLPFLYLDGRGAMVPFSVLWPVKPIRSGEDLTRDYCPRSVTGPEQRRAYLESIFQGPVQPMLDAHEQIVQEWQQTASNTTTASLSASPMPHRPSSRVFIRDIAKETSDAVLESGLALSETPADADIAFDDEQHESKQCNQHNLNAAFFSSEGAVTIFQRIAGMQSWLSPSFLLKTQLSQFAGAALIDANSWWLLTSDQAVPGVAPARFLTSSWTAAARHIDVGYSVAMECIPCTVVADRLSVLERVVLLAPNNSLYLWAKGPRIYQYAISMHDDKPEPYQALAPAAEISETAFMQQAAKQLGPDSYAGFVQAADRAIGEAVRLLLGVDSGDGKAFGVFRVRFAFAKSTSGLVPKLQEIGPMSVAEQQEYSAGFIPSIVHVVDGQPDGACWAQVAAK
ncbi:TP53 regulating kinase [Coemansia sp. RSA 552]|nr:TP53 regulating kinase [Coemansia sp. RSA 552]